jgi:hypothetical protein
MDGEGHKTSGQNAKMLNNGKSRKDSRSGSSPCVRFLEYDDDSTSTGTQANGFDSCSHSGSNTGNKKKSFGSRLGIH